MGKLQNFQIQLPNVISYGTSELIVSQQEEIRKLENENLELRRKILEITTAYWKTFTEKIKEIDEMSMSYYPFEYEEYLKEKYNA